MEFLRPVTWAEALAAKAARPDAVPIAGGTDVMVGVNMDRRRPPALLDLTAVPGLGEWTRDGDRVRIGANVSYRRVAAELAAHLPALAIAARGVGSPQIRARGTVAGNLGTASPAGDCHPALLAARASVEAHSVRGRRDIPIDDFFLGPGRNALAPDELIAAVHADVAGGPQQFAKVGTRNAMVIAVCSFAVALYPAEGIVRTGIGSAGPTPLRAREAEDLLAGALGGPLDPAVASRFGELVAAAARPIDDVRGSAAYRRHALSVLARRTLTWAWADLDLDLDPARRSA